MSHTKNRVSPHIKVWVLCKRQANSFRSSRLTTIGVHADYDRYIKKFIRIIAPQNSVNVFFRPPCVKWSHITSY
jgi:hypothetical protein